MGLGEPVGPVRGLRPDPPVDGVGTQLQGTDVGAVRYVAGEQHPRALEQQGGVAGCVRPVLDHLHPAARPPKAVRGVGKGRDGTPQPERRTWRQRCRQ